MLLDPPRFGARSLWLTWFDGDGTQHPLVVPVDDIPLSPEHRMARGLGELHDTVAEHLAGPGLGHLAMALCRPGHPAVTDSDDEWVDFLGELFDDLVDETWSLHLAAGGRVVPLVCTDLAVHDSERPA
jgi:hypothetical protein